MDFKIVRKGYDTQQVADYKANAEKIMADQAERIAELQAHVDAQSEKLMSFAEKKEKLVDAFVEASEMSAKLKAKAKNRYAEEMERLALFQEKWAQYVKNQITKLAPDEAKKFEDVSGKFQDVLQTYADGVSIEDFSVQNNGKKASDVFAPIKKVTKYLDKVQEGSATRVNLAEPVEESQPVVEDVVVDVQVTEEAPVVEVMEELAIEEQVEEVAIEEEVEPHPITAEQLAEQMVGEVDAEQEDLEQEAISENLPVDITQEEIYDVKQSLADLCEDLGISQDEEKK